MPHILRHAKTHNEATESNHTALTSMFVYVLLQSQLGITAETIDVLWKRAKETLKEMDGSDLDVDPDRVSTEKEQKSTGKDGVKDLSYLSDAAQRKTGRRITHVVAVTCTGIIVPGLEFYIMQALGLPNTTQRLRYIHFS